MKQVYIHIGLHKTGSTYIQKVFAENRDTLKAFGAIYPTLGAEFLFGHHNVAWSLMPNHVLKNTSDFTIERLLDYIESAGAKQFILSSEDFDFLQPEQISKIAHLFADYDVQIVMYVRNPVDAFYSYWQESVKHGDTRSIYDYLDQILANPKPLDYCQIADNWAAIFGSSAMSFAIYENLVADGIDIALYFLREIVKIDIDIEQLAIPKKKVNPSSNAGAIEIIRQLNHINLETNHASNITANFMTFLRQHPEGQKLQHHLQNESLASYDSLELSSLNETFLAVSDNFFRTYRKQIENTGSNQQLYNSQQHDTHQRVRVANAEAVSKKIDIQKLYRLLN